MRPNRSDAHLTPEEEVKKEEETREYFDGIAPKRHSKPSRSEYSTVYSDDLKVSDQETIPELEKFQNLEADKQKVVCEGSETGEEFTETEYYKDLNCVDKQHHTTGAGFIKVEKSRERAFNLDPDTSSVSASHPSSKGNPATNEWIPSADPVIPASDKPNRSDA
ncbi:uncharacterized protein A4U43_C02F400 [Asparagus officinalis]|uniref:Uncharacterized protein n=2 Tax=Asparagus officinalis TaxID=4686 RepID=A0A5P1FGK1_ASPOF|nr:uncharacterized protein LOC109829789 isoform X2 [Asparagus officinalis]ONK76843.1 uncharacterized protein A4U43_C02F400 [Asparagus officinalis]